MLMARQTCGMHRLEQIVLIGSFLPLCWLGMMAVHELGHVLAAQLTGGTVTAVVLHPLAISRTDVSPNPHPLVVAWGGPVAGVLLPVLSWLAGRSARLSATYLLRFFAGFSLIANGAYLGAGSFTAVGDAGDLLRHGAPGWLLRVFGGLTIPLGFWLWHGLGPHFGLGESRGRVDARAAWVSLSLLVLGLTFSVMCSGRH